MNPYSIICYMIVRRCYIIHTLQIIIPVNGLFHLNMDRTLFFFETGNQRGN